MKSIKQTEFWKLPVLLKLVVIWFFVVALNNFWQVIYLLIASFSLGLIPLILGIIEWGLAIGLINRSNESRRWAIFFVFLGFLFWSILLTTALLKDPGSVEGLNINYERSTQIQAVGFFAAYLTLDVGILFVLLRTKTKAFFASENSQQESS